MPMNTFGLSAQIVTQALAGDKTMANIFWDTNVFVYLIEDHPVYGQRVDDIRREMLKRNDRLLTSTVTIGEILVKPLSRGDRALAKQYRQLFTSPEISVSSFDLDAAEAYAIIRQDRTITPPDAIQLACAAAAQVDLFITNDSRLRRKNVPGIKFISSLAEAPI
jgi:predicted nucleic acid-binding protein